MKDKMNDRKALIEAAQQGDREAMTEIYAQSNVQIWRTIRSMIRDEELARDAQQETYLHAFTNLSQLRDPDKLLPWLRTIAKNEARSVLRANKPLLFSDLEEDGDPIELPSEHADELPELSAENRERAALIDEVLSTLSDQQRLIIGMYYYEQCSIREIAEALSIPQGTVKSQLHRGRLRMEQALAELRGKGISLFGVGLFPWFVRLWRRAGGETPAARPPLPSYGAQGTLLGKALAGLTVLGMVGGLAYGASRLAGNEHPVGDFRPPRYVTYSENGPTEPREGGGETEAPTPPQTPPEVRTPDRQTVPAESEAPSPTEAPQPASAQTAPAQTGSAAGSAPSSTGTAAQPQEAEDLFQTEPAAAPVEEYTDPAEAAAEAPATEAAGTAAPAPTEAAPVYDLSEPDPAPPEPAPFVELPGPGSAEETEPSPAPTEPTSPAEEPEPDDTAPAEPTAPAEEAGTPDA